jgi:HSP20 family protein
MSLARKPPARMPLSELALLQREINQLFERLAEFDRGETPTAGEWCPSMDVFECRGALMVVVEVPGLALESLRVLCGDHRLVISGERRERRSAGEGAFLCVERPQGRFQRTIPLDSAVDLRLAQARLENGLLTISLPHLKDRRGRQTAIQIHREPNE